MYPTKMWKTLSRSLTSFCNRLDAWSIIIIMLFCTPATPSPSASVLSSGNPKPG